MERAETQWVMIYSTVTWNGHWVNRYWLIKCYWPKGRGQRLPHSTEFGPTPANIYNNVKEVQGNAYQRSFRQRDGRKSILDYNLWQLELGAKWKKRKFKNDNGKSLQFSSNNYLHNGWNLASNQFTWKASSWPQGYCESAKQYATKAKPARELIYKQHPQPGTW